MSDITCNPDAGDPPTPRPSPPRQACLQASWLKCKVPDRCRITDPAQLSKHDIACDITAREARNAAREHEEAKQETGTQGYDSTCTQALPLLRKSSVVVPTFTPPLYKSSVNPALCIPERKFMHCFRGLPGYPTPYTHSLSLFRKMLATSEKGHKEAIKPTSIEEASSVPTSKEEIKSWNRRSQRRRNAKELFKDMDYEAPAKRRLEDHTPPQSPKGTKYTPESHLVPPPPLWLGPGNMPSKDETLDVPTQSYCTESPKRQRIDPDDEVVPSLAMLTAPFGWKHTPVQPKRYRGPITSSTLFLYRGIRQRTPFIDPHPGSRVDFSTSIPKDEQQSAIFESKAEAQSKLDFVYEYINKHSILPGDDEHKDYRPKPKITAQTVIHWSNRTTSDPAPKKDRQQPKDSTAAQDSEYWRTYGVLPQKSRANPACTRLSSDKRSPSESRSFLQTQSNSRNSSAQSSSIHRASSSAQTQSTAASSLSTSPTRDPRLAGVLESMRSSQAARKKQEEERMRLREQPIWKDELDRNNSWTKLSDYNS